MVHTLLDEFLPSMKDIAIQNDELGDLYNFQSSS